MEERMQLSNTRRMLERAAGLYERYGSVEREDFNIFSVLRAETDEVNLHSRFLAALLRHRKSSDPILRNLEDFLRDVVDIGDFRLDGVEIERERHGIDILIRNPTSREAVVIENKIWARDQHRQLVRYAEQMENDSYCVRCLLYLTLDGHSPDEESSGGRQVVLASYREIIRWLERCQERAYDEPALRESVDQYIHLVRKLTGTDLEGTYMTALKELILENNNLVLVHDLSEAMFEAKVSLLTKFWGEIDVKARKRIPSLPKKTTDSSSADDIRRYLERQAGPRRYVSLQCGIGPGSSLGVGVGSHAVGVGRDCIRFGIRCKKKSYPQEHERLRKHVAGLTSSFEPNDWWPWYDYDRLRVNFKHPARDHLEMLADNKARAEYVDEVVDNLSMVWDKVRDYAAGGAQGS